VVDDVVGIGTSCMGAGLNTTGACTAVYRCGATSGSGPRGLTCVQDVSPKPEVCNGADDNCDGQVDNNIAGVGIACTGPGVNTEGLCTAAYECKGMSGPGPNGLTCGQLVGPAPEICDGLDNNCNGQIDDNLSDPRVGVVGGAPCAALQPLPGTSFPATGAAPPCFVGRSACLAGAVVCEGRIEPQKNQCDGIARDCTGTVNTAGDCPIGSTCVQGNCVLPCDAGEFPCPGGFACVGGSCVSDACLKAQCQAGEVCKLNAQGAAECSNPCDMVSCPSGYRCSKGLCLEDNCRTNGCPDGSKCTGTPPVCVADPCFGKSCEVTEYCDPTTGDCVVACPSVCPSGQVCSGGTCVPDPCAGLSCGPFKVCAVKNGVGSCVDPMCSSGSCGQGTACCGGQCVDNGCLGFGCPSGSACQLDPGCVPTCVQNAPPPKEQIVGAGGGGFTCSALPGQRPRGDGRELLAGLLVVAGLLARSRRARRATCRAEVR
jgi:hypothetical protein